MLLYSTLLCEKLARAPGGVKDLCSLSGGGGGAKQNRSEFSKLLDSTEVNLLIL